MVQIHERMIKKLIERYAVHRIALQEPTQQVLACFAQHYMRWYLF